MYIPPERGTCGAREADARSATAQMVDGVLSIVHDISLIIDLNRHGS